MTSSGNNSQVSRDPDAQAQDFKLGNRIVVVGDAGSGKTTMAAELAGRLDCEHTELDALFWQAGWEPVPLEVFRERVREATRVERWVVDGNYSSVRDIVWPRADTLVWLDFPLALNLWRALDRTVRRVFTREELWNGNREDFWGQFLSRDSLLLYVIKTHSRRRRAYVELLEGFEFAHLRVVRLRNPRQAREWLEAASY